MLKKLAADFTNTPKNIESKILSKIEEVKEEMKEVKREVKRVDAKVEDHETRIKRLEGAVVEANMGGGGGGGRTGGSKGGGAGHGRKEGEEFTANYVEVKGYCTYEERQSKGATRQQIVAFKDGF